MRARVSTPGARTSRGCTRATATGCSSSCATGPRTETGMTTFHFDLCQLPPEAEALRDEVRQFCREHVTTASVTRARSWGGFDPAFSRKMGERGWIGMAWSKEYGGHDRSFLERYVVLEEMLAVGAPVSAHWIADRQSAPTILRFGTEEQKRK